MNFKESVLLVASFLALIACASSGRTALEEKMKDEAAITSRGDLQAEAKSLVEADSNLTTVQKQKLAEIQSATSVQIDELNKKSLELRSVLLKDLLSPSDTNDEMRLIKSQLTQIEKNRLEITFEAVEKAKMILGKKASLHPRIMHDYMSIYEGRE